MSMGNGEAPSEITLEEWSGTASSKFFKTATITANSSTHFAVQRHGSRFHHISNRFLEAFVPEVNFRPFSIFVYRHVFLCVVLLKFVIFLSGLWLVLCDFEWILEKCW